MNLSRQEFLKTTDSAKYIQDKRKLRADLEEQLAKYFENGGLITMVVNKPFTGIHGKSDTYKKHGCRCDKCLAWAVRTGVVKSEKLKTKNMTKRDKGQSQ